MPGAAIGSAPSNGRPEACASRWRSVEPGGPGRVVERRRSPPRRRRAPRRRSRASSPRPSGAAASTLAVRELPTRPGTPRRPPTCSHGQPSTCRKASTTSTLSRDGSAAHLVRGGVRGARRLLARRARRAVGLGVRDGADHAGRRRPARRRVRAGADLPRDHRARPRGGRRGARRRRAHPDLRHRRRRHRRGRARAPRGVRDCPAGDDRRSSPSCSTRAGSSRSRPRP